jgi:hypothetical protein
VLVMRRLLIPLLALVAVPTATAAFSVTLNTASPQTFAAITLNGVDQTKTLPLSITVANTGGTNGTGWSVTAAAGAPTSGANTLSALQVTAVSAAACTGGQCVNATNNVAVPVTLSAGGAKIFNAAAGTGTGSVVLTATLQMTYDAKALPGTYTASLTVAGATSP